MIEANIRHTKKTKHYKAPVMLNHRTLVRISIGVILSMGIVFVSGYVVGFQRAERELAEQVPNTASLKDVNAERILPLPESEMKDTEKTEPKTPLFTEPGETVDVDNPDERQPDMHEEKLAMEPAESQKIKVEVEVVGMSENEPNTTLTSMPTISSGIGKAIGGPTESDTALIMNGNEDNQIVIYDNANEETASYSIQVGMFGSLENAERRVEALHAVDLSAYLLEYTNEQKKLRYKVCFGYFADRQSAINALVIYEKELAGSGYVIPFKPANKPSLKSGLNSDDPVQKAPV